MHSYYWQNTADIHLPQNNTVEYCCRAAGKYFITPYQKNNQYNAGTVRVMKNISFHIT